MKTLHFCKEIANKISKQCISLCLYKIGDIAKAIICLKFKVIYHAYQGDNSYSKNKQFIKNSIECKERVFFLLSIERNFVKTKKKRFYENTMQKLDLRL